MGEGAVGLVAVDATVRSAGDAVELVELLDVIVACVIWEHGSPDLLVGMSGRLREQVGILFAMEMNQLASVGLEVAEVGPSRLGPRSIILNALQHKLIDVVHREFAVVNSRGDGCSQHQILVVRSEEIVRARPECTRRAIVLDTGLDSQRCTGLVGPEEQVAITVETSTIDEVDHLGIQLTDSAIGGGAGASACAVGPGLANTGCGVVLAKVASGNDSVREAVEGVTGCDVVFLDGNESTRAGPVVELSHGHVGPSLTKLMNGKVHGRGTGSHTVKVVWEALSRHVALATAF